MKYENRLQYEDNLKLTKPNLPHQPPEPTNPNQTYQTKTIKINKVCPEVSTAQPKLAPLLFKYYISMLWREA